MSCDVAVSAALLLASFNPTHLTAPRVIPIVAATAPAENPLVKEPLFAGIVGEAKALKREVEDYRKTLKGQTAIKPLHGFDKFQKAIAELSAQDMKGHLELAARGTDGDLKCILRGISQDLPRKLDEVMKASDPAAMELALRDMSYLLNDNVEVITSPPSIQSADTVG